jgi:hypothetical protein
LIITANFQPWELATFIVTENEVTQDAPTEKEELLELADSFDIHQGDIYLRVMFSK